MNELQSPLRVVVTGGSAGIGEGFAREFHRRGAVVTLLARRIERLDAITKELNFLRPDSADFLAVDLSDPSGNELGRAEEYLANSHVDVFVNNAGIGSAGCFETLSVDEEERMIRLNVIATTRLAHAVIPQMKARRKGAIISVSSVAGVQPLPCMATYSATKAFNLHHSLALRYELRPFGVKVLTVCPGPVATEFQGFPRDAGQIGGLRRQSVSSVVDEALRALDRDAAWIVPGVQAKLLAFPARVFPRTIATWVVGKVMARSFNATRG